jgi:hypothetical protein
MNPSFRIVVGSDPDHEDLVGEIYFDDQIVCVLTQESGIANMDIEIFPRPDGTPWMFKLAEIEEALAAVKKRLWGLRRTKPGES